MCNQRNEKGQFTKGAGFKDITGQKFGRLTVINFNKQEGKHTFWTCKCECGKECVRRKDGLKNTSSCGCLSKEINKEKMIKYHENDKHHESKTRFYTLYMGAKSRCNAKTGKEKKNYADRGIKFEWEDYLDFKNDMYESYLEHVKQFGEENTTIDRIDVNGNYCKENCRWATTQVQNNNRRTSVYVIMEDGSRMTLKDYANSVNLPYSNILAKRRRSEYKDSKEIPVSALTNKKDNTEVSE